MGSRKWKQTDELPYMKKVNVHIARQSLRLALLEQLGGNQMIQWNHSLIDFKENDDKTIRLRFQVNGEIKNRQADLIVGADGIRSVVRKILICEEKSPLQYLGCIVILGICPLSALKYVDSPLLDGATVFQTANGSERIYIMPFDADSVMWQLSFSMSEKAAQTLSEKGAQALKQEACRRTQWHEPIPQILSATLEAQITGYPVYDREILLPEMLKKANSATLIGDAAHPMSPFKGQGANQAILDALALGRAIYKECNHSASWRVMGLRKNLLTEFEAGMIERSAVKVKDSADAADFLHSPIALFESNEPRGRCLKRGESF